MSMRRHVPFERNIGCKGRMFCMRIFVVVVGSDNVYSTNRIDVALPKRTCFVH